MGLSLVGCSSTPARCRRRRSSTAQTRSGGVVLLLAVVRHLRRSRWSARPTARRSTCPEAEGELVGGFHTEYSLAEVRAVLPRRVHQHGHRLGAGDDAVPRRLAGAVAARRPSGTARQRGLVADALVHRQALAFMFFFIWLRGTLPRLRYDQFMSSAGRCSSRPRWSGSLLVAVVRALQRVRRRSASASVSPGASAPRVRPRRCSLLVWAVVAGRRRTGAPEEPTRTPSSTRSRAATRCRRCRARRCRRRPASGRGEPAVRHGRATQTTGGGQRG